MRRCGGRERRRRGSALEADGSVIYRFASPVMQLYYKNLLHRFSLFRFTTYTRAAGFRVANPHISRPGGTRNPSVLLSPEMVYSVRQHPLSGNSGRKRYNTLDFPQENRVPTGRFHPYWKPRIKGICHPFEIPAVLKSVYTNLKTVFASTHPKTQKSPQSILQQGEERLWGFSMPHS